MRIQLLSPAGEIHRSGTGIFKTSLRYAPLTLTTLAALVPPELNADVTIQDEGVQPLDLDFDADLVGITAITGTSLRAYDVAERLPAQVRLLHGAGGLAEHLCAPAGGRGHRRAADVREAARAIHRPQPGRGRPLRQGAVPGDDPVAHPLGRPVHDAYRRGRRVAQ